jgi:hypothetical protein
MPETNTLKSQRERQMAKPGRGVALAEAMSFERLQRQMMQQRPTYDWTTSSRSSAHVHAMSVQCPYYHPLKAGPPG